MALLKNSVEPDEALALARRIGDGSLEALTGAYNEYAPALFTCAVRILGDRADAEDVVHDVFVALPRIVRSYDGRGSFGGWLRTVTIRSATLRVRRARRLAELLERFVPPRVSDPEIRDLDIDSALQKLHPALRAVFVLRVFEDKPHEEIADLLGISKSLSLVRLHRARKQMIALLRLERS